MSQHDFDIANQTASNARVDINLALKALGSLSSGVTAPTTTYANMLWYDTANNILKMRSEADDAWITLGTLDQSLNTFTPAGLVGTSADADFTVDPTLLATRATIKTFVDAIPAPSAPTTTEVLSATAGATAGAVGTYAFMERTGNNSAINIGGTIGGSSIRYAGVDRTSSQAMDISSSATVPSGTWQCMGFIAFLGDTSSERASLFLRIA
jgi:hypothetical protein